MKTQISIFPQRIRNRMPSAFRSLAGMENEMERWMQQSPLDWVADYNGFDFSPSCDFKETDEEYVVKFDIPGVKKEEVSIEVESNRLTVSGERREEKEEKNEKHFLSETYHGSFMRSFNLPTAVKEDKVDAKYSDGVLTIKIPKQEATKSKKVKIQ